MCALRIYGGTESKPINTRAIALKGRVPVKISNENGNVSTGDYLTVSNTKPGFAMKMTESGQSLGVALEDYDDSGQVMVFVNLSYWMPSLELMMSATSSATSTASSISEDIFNFIIEKLAELGVIVTEAFTRINNLFAGTIHIENQLCVDDVCISKENLKALLIQAGGVSINASSGNEDTSTTTVEPASESPSPSEPEPAVEEQATDPPSPEATEGQSNSQPTTEITTTDTATSEPASEPTPEPVSEPVSEEPAP